MSYDPTDAIHEILGRRAKLGFDPSDLSYTCPFVNTTCTKRSTADKRNPYPVCTLERNKGGIICVCPKRFYERDFLQDVIEHAWTGPKPRNPQVAPEVQMEDFGNVDFVIADFDENGTLDQFLSVELQAIDITGSVRPAYDAILRGEILEKRPTYGFNWKNVSKRYMNQLIAKGYYHHHWGTKIVAVIQDDVYEYFRKDANFFTTEKLDDSNINIVFMTYGFECHDGNERTRKLVLKKVEGTHHTNLQNAVLYKSAPSKDAFAERIKSALNRHTA